MPRNTSDVMDDLVNLNIHPLLDGILRELVIQNGGLGDFDDPESYQGPMLVEMFLEQVDHFRPLASLIRMWRLEGYPVRHEVGPGGSSESRIKVLMEDDRG